MPKNVNNINKKSLLVNLAVVFLLSSSLISCADEAAREQIADTQIQMSKMQKDLNTLNTKVNNQKGLDLMAQINGLQSQINQLNGTIADLNTSTAQSLKTQQDTINSLDARIQALENPGNKSNFTANTAATSAVATPTLANAVAQIKAKDFNNAITSLQAIKASSTSDSATKASASYYLSVAYLANTQNNEAISEAKEFIAKNPKNKSVPDAMRVLFIAYNNNNDTDNATKIAQKLIKQYPASPAAKKVSASLDSSN